MDKKIRESNFELLRLIAIFFVICHHLIIKSADTCGYVTPYNSAVHGYTGLITNSLVIGGVNIFILISGWFGIKRIWEQVARLIIDCFLYCAVANIFCVLTLNTDCTVKEFMHSMIFTHNWFVMSFVEFLIAVPVVNKALSVMGENEHLYAIMLLVILNVILGYGLGGLNGNGYNALNFIFLYIIARYLRRISNSDKYAMFARKGLYIWVIAAISVVMFFLTIYYVVPGKLNAQKIFGYNNPFVLISSVGIFCYFSTLKFKSFHINKMAKGVFGIFLLHTTTLFIPWRMRFFGEIFVTGGYPLLLLSAFILFLICLFVSLLIEWLKGKIFPQHISQIKNQIKLYEDKLL